MSVYKAINAVQAELAREGIAKNRKNEQQGYKFRGIDEVYNALSPMLARHGLCILPRCTERACVERVNAKGTALFYVTVRAEFDFVASEDGSKHTVTTYGEAMDSGDKATNKAMSAAYKYACMQAFSIPTEGDNDADATTHEVQAKPARRADGKAFDSPHKPTDGAGDHLGEDKKAELEDLAAYMVDCHKDGKDMDAIRVYYALQDNDEKVYVWKLLGSESKLRATVKANSPHKEAA